MSEAGGQLFWVGPTDRAMVSFYTRPAAGGAARLLGTVAGPDPKGDGYVTSVAFDGTNYAVALRREEEDRSSVGDEDDCGVCEADVTVQTEVIAGTLAGAPKVLLNCTTYDQARRRRRSPSRRAGRSSRPCPASFPSGIVEVDSAGTLTSFDPAGTAPLQGTGSWLTYASKDATKVTDLTGGGSYTVPVAYSPNSQDPVTQALLLQADGSLFLSAAFFRAGGTTPPVPAHAKWRYSVPETLFAGDRLFYRYGGADLAQLSVTNGQGPRAIIVPALAYKRPLLLTGSVLDVAGYSCTGAETPAVPRPRRRGAGRSRRRLPGRGDDRRPAPDVQAHDRRGRSVRQRLHRGRSSCRPATWSSEPRFACPRGEAGRCATG